MICDKYRGKNTGLQCVNITYNMGILLYLTACITNSSLESFHVKAGSAILTAIPIFCVSGSMYLLKRIEFNSSFIFIMYKGVAGNYLLYRADMHHV
jgi:hypothetical protein